MKKKRYAEPAPLSELVPKILREMKPAKTGLLAEARRAWAEVAGSAAASRTRVVSVESGILTVEVASAALKHQLATFGAERLLEGLKKRLPGAPLRAIRYRVGAG